MIKERIDRVPMALFLGVLSVYWSLSPQDTLEAIEPVLLTSMIVLFLFLIIRRFTGDERCALVFATAAAFATMLWPYAYIGLEVRQSFFVMSTAYLVFRRGERGSWPELFLIATSAAMAMNVKSSGAFLAPALAYLLFQFITRGELPEDKKRVVRQVAVTVGIVFVFYLGYAFVRELPWQGASGSYVRGFIVPDVVSYFMNATALIGSPNKGIVVFAPVVLLGFLWRPERSSPGRPLFVFAVLVTAGLIFGYSFSTRWADELWGPRYLHAIVGPWVISMSTSEQVSKRSREKVLALGLAVALGVGVSFLGAFFQYGALHAAAVDVNQAQVETIQSNPAWNHVRFNARLLRIWVNPRAGRFWVPTHQWYFEPAESGYIPQQVNLGIYAEPHSALVRAWRANWGLWSSLVASLFIGLSLLFTAFRTVRRSTKYTVQLLEREKAASI